MTNIDDAIIKLNSHDPNLTILDLSGELVTSQPMKKRELFIAIAKNTSLTSLHLWGNKIGDEGARHLAGNTTLTSLDLNMNNIGAEGARHLAGNTTLTSLNLYENNIGDKGAQHLAGNTTLTSLDLAGNYIGDEGARHLAGNTTLTSLGLYINNIGDEGARHLAGNTTLTSLNLTDNSIGEGARHLAGNTTLTSLNLVGNNIGAEGNKLVSSTIRRNSDYRIMGFIALMLTLINAHEPHDDNAIQKNAFSLLSTEMFEHIMDYLMPVELENDLRKPIYDLNRQLKELDGDKQAMLGNIDNFTKNFIAKHQGKLSFFNNFSPRKSILSDQIAPNEKATGLCRQ